MNEENPDISRLIKLKRFEQPEEGFFEQFLEDFREHQAESAKPLSYLKRINASVERWGFAQWSGVTVAACATLLCAVVMSNAVKTTPVSPEAVAKNSNNITVNADNENALNTIIMENDVEFSYVDLSTTSVSHEVEF